MAIMAIADETRHVTHALVAPPFMNVESPPIMRIIIPQVTPIGPQMPTRSST